MRFTVFISVLLSLHGLCGDAQDPPRLLYADGAKLQQLSDQYKKGDEASKKSAAAQIAKAEKALQQTPLSVTQKELPAESGDKHDYVSMAPYFWPDPAKPDGKPYIRKDGKRNPEIHKYTDKDKMGRMAGSVKDLAIGYYLTGNETYAEHAALLLRTWFLNESTRMNPNLDYAQFVPGVSTGRGTGLIDTTSFVTLVDSLTLLEHSSKWTAADREGARQWFSKFLDWMQKSKNGKDEAGAKNNHGSWYDVQVVTLALFLNKDSLARETAENAKQKRIAVQIDTDGQQSLEMSRTNSWSYCIFNLRALTTLAMLGDRVNVDLWSYSTKDGRSLRKAIDWLLPYADGTDQWPGSQISGVKASALTPVLKLAAPHYPDSKFKELLQKLHDDDPSPLDP